MPNNRATTKLKPTARAGRNKRNAHSPPEPPPCVQDGRLREVQFGHHATHVARLNHGSFGAPPRSVIAATDSWRNQWLANPDAIYFSNALDHAFGKAERAGAEALGVDPNSNSVAVLENATAAANAIASRWARMTKPHEAVMLPSHAYGGVVRAFLYHLGPERVVIAPVPFPFANEADVVTALANAAANAERERGIRVRFVLLDHVSSQPSYLVPVKRIVRLCRGAGVEEVAVDGSHALGNLCEIDIGDLDVDFYFANVHKWAFGCPTAALLWSKDASLMGGASPAIAPSSSNGVFSLFRESMYRNRHFWQRKPTMRDSRNPGDGAAHRIRMTTDTLHHPVASWNLGHGFAKEAAWIGTRDYSAALASPQALDFLRRMDGLPEHNRAGAEWAAQMCAERWQHAIDDPPVPAESSTAMAMIPLPQVLGEEREHAAALRQRLREKYAIEASVEFIECMTPEQASERAHEQGRAAVQLADLASGPLQGRGFVRLSYQAAYGCPDDVVRLADAVAQEAGL